MIEISEFVAHIVISGRIITLNMSEVQTKKIGDRVELVCKHSKRILEVEIIKIYDNTALKRPRVCRVSLRRVWVRVNTQKK